MNLRNLAATFAVAALAACADQPVAVPVESPAASPALAVIQCRVDARAATVGCTDVAGGTARRTLVTVGGQNHYVRLASSGTAYDSASDVVSSTVTVQNLLATPLGTTNGTTPDPKGVRVFFATISGPVTVANPSGVGAFTAANQPYFQYDGILAPGATSPGALWRFRLNGASTFTFTVYVQAEVSSLASAYPHLVSLESGEAYNCGLDGGGQAVCWGDGLFGQLGDGAKHVRNTPVRSVQPGGLAFAALSAGKEHVCAVTAGGEAYCWGRNQGGQLGDSTLTDRTTPTRVLRPAGETFTSIGAGFIHTCATTASGEAYCWGDNELNELGDSTTTPSRVPVRVRRPAGVSFATVTAGDIHSCALDTTGQAWCWGNNVDGELGASVLDGPTPVKVEQPGGVVFKSIKAGYQYVCALATSGQAYCWGGNSWGKLGIGSGPGGRTPAAVAQPNGVLFDQLEAGFWSTCAVSTTGQGYCWGADNDRGLNARRSPAPVAQPAGVQLTMIPAGGSSHTCALSTGPAYCWGSNSDGELGDGTSVGHAEPTLVAGTR